MDVHPDSGWATGEEVRLFVSSRHPDCGIAEVEFERGLESAAKWTLFDLDANDDLVEDCGMWTADQYYINGVHAARDGRWLFAFGGDNGSASSGIGAVCTIDLESGASGVYSSLSPVVRGAQLQMEVRTLTSQPHVNDVWYFGGVGSSGCDLCTPAGIFALQRRRAWSTPTLSWVWKWGFYRVSDDDLPVRSVVDLDWGPASGTRYSPARMLYASTAGGSWWDGEVSW